MLSENQGTIFQQRRNVPENLFSKEFRAVTALSSFLIWTLTEQANRALVLRLQNLIENSVCLQPQK